MKYSSNKKPYEITNQHSVTTNQRNLSHATSIIHSSEKINTIAKKILRNYVMRSKYCIIISSSWSVRQTPHYPIMSCDGWVQYPHNSKDS